MDNTPAVGNLNNRNCEIADEYSCTSDKKCVYETEISEEYVKREQCDSEEDYVSIKEEIIEDRTIVVQESRLTANIKENYLTSCEGCGEEYELYCIKCPMLIRIFNSDSSDLTENAVMHSLPKDFVDICKTQSGLGTVTLKVIPKEVVFGPLKGLDSTKDGAVSKWILKNGELVYTKQPKRLIWMQYIRKIDHSSHSNLTPFQCEGELYYRSVCQISVGDELLVYWDESAIQDSYLKPQICERLDEVYACTLCCAGYKAMCHLAVHNSRCPKKKIQNSFCKGIIQCSFCKIYLDEKEYSDYHMDRCCKSKGEIFDLHQEKMRNQGKVFDLHLPYHTETKLFADTHPPYKTRTNPQRNSDDKSFACTICPHKTKTKSLLKLHMSIHKDNKTFVCSLCSLQLKTQGQLTYHLLSHNDDKPFECTHCPYKTKTSWQLKLHNAIHSDDKPFECTQCSFKTKTKLQLKRHMATHSDDKPFSCSLCSYKAKRNSDLKKHMAAHK